LETRKIALEPEKYYHIYNRGINGQNIFLEERNYTYFLQKYAQYVHPYVETYAYCLLKNHFHILIRIKSEEKIRQQLKEKKDNLSISWHLSNIFSSLFKSYAQAINKGYHRTGGLFEEPFHRIEIKQIKYLRNVIQYIHFNPQKHEFVKDFKDYQFSSYQSLISNKNTKLKKEEILKIFDGDTNFIQIHQKKHNYIEIKNFIIEFD
jgi:REP element-mobilizing transposase RayT